MSWQLSFHQTTPIKHRLALASPAARVYLRDIAASDHDRLARGGHNPSAWEGRRSAIYKFLDTGSISPLQSA